MIKRLTIISKEYPTPTDPSYAFVGRLAEAFADAGVEVTVVAPMSITRMIKSRRHQPPKLSRVTTPGGSALTVLRPRTISTSNKKLLFIDGAQITYKLFKRAAWRAIKDTKPDAIYGHFVFSGMCASELAARLGTRAFLGYGESSPANYSAYKKPFIKRALASLAGVISVSTENSRELRSEGIIGGAVPVGVFPNAVDPQAFKPIPPGEARRALGIPQDAFIVCFTGSFIERKGILVLSEALDSLVGVNSFFIGRGPLQPTCAGALHVGLLPHDQIPRYLAASDVFVLPTVAEGCCNAIIEALSMGIPVVSSDLPFNYDVLDETNSILVDPRDPSALAGAISSLRRDPELRARLAKGALLKGMELTLSERVKNILDFINNID